MRNYLREEEKGSEGNTATEEGGGKDHNPPEEAPLWRNLGARSSRMALLVMARVVLFLDERNLGKAFGCKCGYRLPNDEKEKVRFPVGSVVLKGRLPDDRTPDGNLRLAPDFAMEVVSSNDSAYEVEEKRVAFLRAGVRLVWGIYPPTRTVFVFRPGGTVAVLGEGDVLSGEDVLPDFTFPVARLFENL